MSARSRKTFEQLVTLPDGAIPLAESALLMACEEYPQLEISPYLDKLDSIAHNAANGFPRDGSPLDKAERLNEILFDELGFRGNSDDYYDPRNSFFNDVLDRRLGIPITLSVVYLEVARRLNFPLAGVGMPAHFILKYADAEQEFFLDAFDRGRILTHDDCREQIQRTHGDTIEFDDRLLARSTSRQILARMLNNLKRIYLKSHAYDKGVGIIDMMLIVDPEDLDQYRDRGILRYQLHQFGGAIKDLEHYVESAPNSTDCAEIVEHLRELRRIRAMMN
jgi:regulator of sirC expression with transglutaminase-like and TPR domain